jgi:hypothetical protein
MRFPKLFRRSPSPAPESQDADARAAGRPIIWTLLTLAAVAGLYAAGWNLLRRTVADSSKARVRNAPTAIDIADKPAWLSDDDVCSINRIGLGAEGRNLYDSDLSSALASHYEAEPWVARVNFVRRRYPDRLDVSLEIRRPFASVEAAGPAGARRFHVVDAEAVELPIEPRADPYPDAPVIIGLRAGVAAPRSGNPWTGGNVSDAVAVLRAVEGRIRPLPAGVGQPPAGPVNVRPAEGWPLRLQIAADRFGRPDHVIIFGGIPFHWGEYHAPGQTPYGMLTTEHKLENLELAQRAVRAVADRRIASVQLDTRRREPTLIYVARGAQ